MQILRIGLLFTIFLLFNLTELKSQNYFEAEFPDVWERSSKYTKTVAESMPENLYDFKVYDDGMSFKEQQMHIVGNISFLTKFIIGEYHSFYSREEITQLSKKQTLAIMDSAFQYVYDLIENTTQTELSQKVIFKGVEMSKENIFYLIRSHLTHHMGQTIVYLRMNNIDAPEYVGW